MEAAYRRGDLFAKWVKLMADWAAFVARPAAEVRPFRGRHIAAATVMQENVS
ncbi:MAG: hypothetical protein ACREFJ_14670 [Acetobacteraceae bacterium]